MEMQREELRAPEQLQEANLCEVEQKDGRFGTPQRYEAQRSTSNFSLFLSSVQISLFRRSLASSSCVQLHPRHSRIVRMSRED